MGMNPLNPVAVENQMQRLLLQIIEKITDHDRQLLILAMAPQVYVERATVSAYTSGTTCTITYEDLSARTVGFLNGYTPVVGHVVEVFNLDNRVFILKQSQ